MMLPNVISTYDLTKMNTEECVAAVNPYYLGYVPFYQGDIFTLDLDIIAITIANAVSYLLGPILIYLPLPTSFPLASAIGRSTMAFWM
jgi:hypothetical protein